MRIRDGAAHDAVPSVAHHSLAPVHRDLRDGCRREDELADHDRQQEFRVGVLAPPVKVEGLHQFGIAHATILLPTTDSSGRPARRLDGATSVRPT